MPESSLGEGGSRLCWTPEAGEKAACAMQMARVQMPTAQRLSFPDLQPMCVPQSAHKHFPSYFSYTFSTQVRFQVTVTSYTSVEHLNSFKLCSFE